MRTIKALLCVGVMCAFAASPRVEATTVKHFDLTGMTSSAARVFRGTVTDVRAGTVKVGGGELTTIIYRIRVTEPFKGEFATFKDVTYADVEMLGDIKARSGTANVKHFSIFRDIPQLELNKDYLLFLTAESSVALSSPVGLAQGCFEIDTSIPSEPTANGVNNAGLAADLNRGAVPYANIAARVRALISGQGVK
jgi:hypothetical protein